LRTIRPPPPVSLQACGTAGPMLMMEYPHNTYFLCALIRYRTRLCGSYPRSLM
jgi:hypothetical protein